MDPEIEIEKYLQSKGVQRAVLKDMLDDFAHNLAEAIRAYADEYFGPDSRHADGMRQGADLIDPKVAK